MLARAGGGVHVLQTLAPQLTATSPSAGWHAQVLQAYDFLHLRDTYGCHIQLGGADQWGNITAGCDLVRKARQGASVYGLTVPLVTTSAGVKFGKSAGNAVWLEESMTSPYHLYQVPAFCCY